MIELADIIAPVAPPPAPPPYEWIALGVALFALILFFVLRLWLKRTRANRLARAALKRAERELHDGKLDARAAAFEIARALKCSPSRPQNTSPSPSQAAEGSLRSSGAPTGVPLAVEEGRGGGEEALTPPPLPTLSPPRGRGEDLLSTAAWIAFTQKLDRARFSSHPIDTQQAAQLLAQAHQWIGRAP